MLNEIDSSEIIVYLARKKFLRRSTAVIRMSDIIQLADFLTQSDATIRVDLSRSSFENLCNYTYHLMSYDSENVKIVNMRHPRIKFVMHQYRPTTQIVRMLNRVSI